MLLLDLTNEVVTLVAQIVTFVFSIGIAIYAFRFPIMREGADKLPGVVMNQRKRLSKKIVQLFFAGVTAVLYGIIVKIVISQFIRSGCILWLFLGGAIILLLIVFFCLYNLFPEIGIIDK